MQLFGFFSLPLAGDCSLGPFRTLRFPRKLPPKPGKNRSSVGTLIFRLRRLCQGATNGSGQARPMVTGRMGVTNLKGKGLVAVKAVKRGKRPRHRPRVQRNGGRSRKARRRRWSPSRRSPVIGRSTRPKTPEDPWISTMPPPTGSTARRGRLFKFYRRLILLVYARWRHTQYHDNLNSSVEFSFSVS